MKILITGSKGQLGNELHDVLEERAPGKTVYTDREELDLTNRKAVRDFLDAGDFTHIINCAAYTAVDRAEEEKHACSAINVDAVSNLAALADERDIKLVHISTDYVFDGTSHLPYKESDKPAPQCVYGTTKRKGETALLGLAPSAMIVRTGWLYSSYGHNFVKTVLAKSKPGAPMSIVSDQIGTPTYAADLASVLADIVLRDRVAPGIFHFSNEGVASWYDFAVATLEAAGRSDEAAALRPISTSDYPTPATRPAYSVLDKSKIKATFGLNIPHWQNALRRCVLTLNLEH